MTTRTAWSTCHQRRRLPGLLALEDQEEEGLGINPENCLGGRKVLGLGGREGFGEREGKRGRGKGGRVVDRTAQGGDTTTVAGTVACPSPPPVSHSDSRLCCMWSKQNLRRTRPRKPPPQHASSARAAARAPPTRLPESRKQPAAATGRSGGPTFRQTRSLAACSTSGGVCCVALQRRLFCALLLARPWCGCCEGAALLPRTGCYTV